MSVSLELPYKVCDYKPAFGLIFEDYLRGVDFWGHCDVDVVWGSIRKFLATDEILSRYDVVSPRRRRIAGACTLYRNTDEVNRLFLADRKFELVIRERENRRYDEKGWSRFVRKQSDNGSLRVSWSNGCSRAACSTRSTAVLGARRRVRLHGHVVVEPARCTTCSSIRTRCREVLYVDFRRWKRASALPCDFGYEDDPRRFYISHTHISTEPDRRSPAPRPRPGRATRRPPRTRRRS